MSEHLIRLEAVAHADHPYPADRFAGRGIVIGAGGAEFFACAWSCVWTLRGLGCELPVEFWYLGSYEMDPQMLAAAASVGIRCVNASDIARALPEPPRILNGWELKPFATIHSRFEEVLYLDADQLPVLDPTFLFDAPGYLQTGAIFWPDLAPFDRAEWLPEVAWQNVGLAYETSRDFESGQLVVNKRTCWRELAVTMHMNEWSDYYYQFLFGDKSTWHLAWKKCGRAFAMPAADAGWNWPAIIQHDFEGRVVFQHCCQGKESLVAGDALQHLKSWHLNHEAAKALKPLWRGEIWSALDERPPETQLAEKLVGTYRYERIGLGSRELELCSGGKIGRGQAACEKRWTLRLFPIKDSPAIPKIVIVGEAHKQSEIGMMFLAPPCGREHLRDSYTSDYLRAPHSIFCGSCSTLMFDPRKWTGRWSEFEKGSVELTKL